MEPISEYSFHRVMVPLKAASFAKLSYHCHRCHNTAQQGNTSNAGTDQSLMALSLGCKEDDPFIPSQMV